MTVESPIDELNSRIFPAYEALGFPRALVEEWAVSRNDVADLIAAAASASPSNILEVGTYVGVSTMLLALAFPFARIVTVDPDLPLEIELRAAGSAHLDRASALTHHTIARRAAETLGVADRITFVKGGFSTGETFASIMDAGGRQASGVVGPRVCADYGPFDFVFVDGLHAAFAVREDLRLSVAALAPAGVIALHDCIGFWGSSVRQGVYEFLSENPALRFRHPRYAEVYRSVGVVTRRAELAAGRPAGSSAALRQVEASLAAGLFGSGRVLSIVVVDSGSQAEESAGAVTLADLSMPDLAASKIRNATSLGPDSALSSLDLADFAEDAVLSAVFELLKRTGASLMLAPTPPGEEGVAGPHSRPLARLVSLANDAGCNVFLPPFSAAEHARYAMLPQPRALGLTSQHLHFVVVSAAEAMRDAQGAGLIRLDPDAAHRVEQQALQQVHLACGFRLYLDVAQREQKIRIDDAAAMRQQLSEATALHEALLNQFRDAVARADSIDQQRLLEVGAALESVELERRTVERQRLEIAQYKLQEARFSDEIAKLAAAIDVTAAEARSLKSAVSGQVRQLAAAYATIGEIDAAVTKVADSPTTDASGEIDPNNPLEIADALKAVHARVSSTLHGFVDELAASRTSNEALSREIELIRRSFSWRAMEPYRAIRRALSRRSR